MGILAAAQSAVTPGTQVACSGKQGLLMAAPLICCLSFSVSDLIFGGLQRQGVFIVENLGNNRKTQMTHNSPNSDDYFL